MTLNLFESLKNNTFITDAKEHIKKVYLADTRPWVVGNSVGNDSKLEE